MPALSVLAEDPVRLGDAVAFFPSCMRPSAKRLRVWVTAGTRVKGGVVQLEAVRVGGWWVTSRAAVERFLAATTAAATAQPVPVRDPDERAAAGKAAGDRLRARWAAERAAARN